MAWKCPECGMNNDEVVSECACGYAFYKVLGVKPDASEKEVKQAYKYLLNVWETDRISDDPLSKKKAQDRLKKINEAYNNFRHLASKIPGAEKRNTFIKIASFTGIIFLCLLILLIFFKSSQTDKSQKQSTVQLNEKVKPQPLPADHASEDLSHVKEARQQTHVPEQGSNFYADMSPEKAEETAIELTKKSHALDRFFDVETLMRKWTEENSGKIQIIGWKAKRIDERTYLVGYTASDGLSTKGFYFDIDINTGTVRHIADHPELQKKYGIQYNK
jgi:hypothetical protein